MTKAWRVFNWIIGCMVLLFTFSLLAYAETGSPFSIDQNGQISIDGLHFSSTEQYYQSDYFKKTGKRCGAKSPSGLRSLLASPKDAADCTVALTVIQEKYWPAVVLTIPVVVHVIHRTDGLGYVDEATVRRQIQVLNEDFGALSGSLGEDGFNTKIQFHLVQVTWTANNNWFLDMDEYGFKSTLGWDQNHYCNIYVNSAGGYLGYSYFPQEDAGSVYDGLVIYYETFGGRDEGISPYNQGRTTIHEMGHYLGLEHTFQGYGACLNGYGVGDLILDTPAESTDHYGCTQTYTCGSPDPIHNYMNYTDDLCMNQFTSEQGNRMVCSLLNYRPDLASMSAALVPALNPWGMGALGLLLAVALFLLARRRSTY